MTDNNPDQAAIPVPDEAAATTASTSPDPDTLDPEDRVGVLLHRAADQLVKDLQEVREEHPAGKFGQLVDNLLLHLPPLRDMLAEMLTAAGHLL